MGLERRERRKVDGEVKGRRRGHRCECRKAKHSGTILARVTGLLPTIRSLGMLTTSVQVPGTRFPGSSLWRPLRRAPAPTGQSSLR